MRYPMYFRRPPAANGTTSPNANRVPTLDTALNGRRRRSLEISYSSTLLLLWTCLLAWVSWQAQFRMQACSILTLCTIALTSEHGESRLLMPLIFLSERCLDHAMDLGHSPILFYASTLLSYLSLIAAKAEQRGKSAHDRNVVAEIALYAVVGFIVVFFIVKDKVISFGGIVYVVSGYIFFVKLSPAVGDNEAILIGSLVGFYMCDICVNNNLSIHGGRESVLLLNAPGYLTSYTHIASRGMILCTIYIVSIIGALSRWCLVPTNKNSKSSRRRISRKRITIIFWVSNVVVGLTLALVISYQFRENVLRWLYAYIMSSRFRMWTMVCWVTLLPLAVYLVDVLSVNVRQTVRRKLFHFIAVVAFTPSIMIDPPFMAFAFSTAISVSVLMEVGRYYNIYGAQHISHFIVHHIDDRDSIDGVVRTHIYLLIGLGISIMMRYRHLSPDVKPVPAIIELSINIIPGIVSLGIVDACAAIIGSSYFLSSRRTLGRYLKNNLFTERANTSITHKTTTGTLGGLLCGMVFWVVILTIAEVPITGPVWYTFTMIAACTLTECFMDGIDNLQLPLVVLGAVNNLFALLVPAKELWVNPAITRPNPTTATSLASALTSPWKSFPSPVSPSSSF
ncbi:putative dolichol kinase [Leptomonas pyrrhocoris]|uniref:dolichol kinase n=1 Tax=Leptomonas pyrrhocoris TaxID=157538 RepID=A0A0N0E0C6_LEPPY|nr:putative dolichol kinase [Leptomonas pyrrhocoris]KPA86295.1 putative dolichol kinase [Leptomonas pyrrhocoris]|eukprot:XP_015664734.1 putative dolichol kinase [Leptomonas pyrrhocoris]